MTLQSAVPDNSFRVDDEGPAELAWICLSSALAIPCEERPHHRREGLRPGELPQSPARDGEGAVEGGVAVDQDRKADAEAGAKIGCGGSGAYSDSDDLPPQSVDLVLPIARPRDRLPAEESPEVAQEDEEGSLASGNDVEEGRRYAVGGLEMNVRELHSAPRFGLTGS